MSDSPAEKTPTVLGDDPLLRQVPEVEGYKVLEPCVLYAKVGEGGMGAVYRGRHLNLDIDVAIKCLKSSLAEQSPAFVTRFQREARIAASVHHQNLVQVYDISHKNGVHYLVMEFVRGETARERVTRKKRLREGEALKVMIGAASGLAEAHSQKIVHRDIKPDNILVSFDGKVKVSDLGLAKALELDNSPSLTMGVMGTPQYMAPEQWDDASTVGPAADVWALGATFYFLLTGEHAIPGGSMQQIYKRICVDPFPDISEKLPTLSKEMKAVLEKCVQREVKKRYADCRELLKDLNKIALKDSGNASLVDAESGTLKVPPLLSPPPAEQLGHIKVAIQGEEGSTLGVGSKANARLATPARRDVSPPPTPVPSLETEHLQAGAQPQFATAPVVSGKPKWAWGAVAAVSVVLAGALAWRYFGDSTARAAPSMRPVIRLDPIEPTDQARIDISGTILNADGIVILKISPPIPGEPGELHPDERGAFKQSILLPKEDSYVFEVANGDLRERIVVVYAKARPAVNFDLPERTDKSEITISGAIKNQTSATLSVKPAIAGLPMDLDLSEGRFSVPVSLPGEDTYFFKVATAGAEQERTLVYDLPNPVITISPIDLYLTTQAITISGRVASYREPLTLRSRPPIPGMTEDIAVEADGSFTKAVLLPVEALYSFTIGTRDAQDQVAEVVFDVTPPRIESLLPAGPQKDPSVTPSCVVTDNVSGVASVWIRVAKPNMPLERQETVPLVKQDGTFWQTNKAIVLDEGTSTVMFFAQDKAGRETSDPIEVPVEVDSSGPSLLSVTPSAGGELLPGPRRFTFQFSELVFTLKVNDKVIDVGEGQRIVEASITVPDGLPEDSKTHSPFTLRLKATDSSGNERETSENWEVRLTPTAPDGWVVDSSRVGQPTDFGYFANYATDPRTGIAFVLVNVKDAWIWVAETEVTFEQFKRWNKAPATAKGDTLAHPVIYVGWKDANEFCRTFGYRLPSVQEWQIACLGKESENSNYCCGPDPKKLWEYAWFAFSPKIKPGDGRQKPQGAQATRQLKANNFGLFDMHGNVWEWCSDTVKDKNSAKDQWKKAGGSWNTDEEKCKATSETKSDGGTSDTGFRPVVSTTLPR